MTGARVREAVAVAVALALLVSAPAEGWGAAPATHSNSAIGLLAIDSSPQGNTATSLGQIDGCARLEVGSRLTVDYVVDAIPQDRPMVGFEVEIRYDPRLLEADEVDSGFLLAAVGSYSPFTGLSDELPDSDGQLRISALDLASSNDPKANVESGAGVLSRISFRAKAQGIGQVAIASDQEPQLYPLILDTQDEMILANRLGTASVAVGQDCPPQLAQPQIADLAATNATILAANPQLRASPRTSGAIPSQPSTATTGLTPGPSSPTLAAGNSEPAKAEDGRKTWIIVVFASLVLGAGAVVGGWYLRQRFRQTKPGG